MGPEIRLLINMTKEMEVITRLDRVIELLETMSGDEAKAIKGELKELHDWRLTCTAKKNSNNRMIDMVRFFGPWLFALLFVLFEHKFKIL